MDDDKSSNGSVGSYKAKNTKGSKQTTNCSTCGEPDRNSSKCKIRNMLFWDFCNKRGHSAKACRFKMNGHNVCVHCRLDHGNDPCPQSHQNNREDLRNSPSTSSVASRFPRQNFTPQSSQPTIPKPYDFDIYPPPGTNRPTGFNNYRSRGPNEDQNFGPARSSTLFGSPNLE